MIKFKVTIPLKTCMAEGLAGEVRCWVECYDRNRKTHWLLLPEARKKLIEELEEQIFQLEHTALLLHTKTL